MHNSLSAEKTVFLAHLEASLSDARLSDQERRELTALLSEARPLDESLRRVRNRAFALAREQLAAPTDAAAVLAWLEGVMRAIDGAREPLVPEQHAVSFSPGEDCLRMIVQQLRSARQSVDICVFTLSDDRISAEVLAAHQRGVSVRIITDNDKAGDEGSDVEQLQGAGISVRVDRSSAHMHHKFAIFDRRCLLNGSYNWTRSAARYNEENVVLSTAPALLAEFSGQFEKLWRALA